MEQSSRRDDAPLPQRVFSACGGLTLAGKANEEATLKKLQAKRMDWSNESRISSRVGLANFLRSIKQGFSNILAGGMPIETLISY
jgi:hypothetical protein